MPAAWDLMTMQSWKYVVSKVMVVSVTHRICDNSVAKYLKIRSSVMLLLHEPSSSGICLIHVSIYEKMRRVPVMHSKTVLLSALNKMKTEDSGNIPVPITFLFIERLNKYMWKYASFYVMLLATDMFILNSQ